MRALSAVFLFAIGCAHLSPAPAYRPLVVAHRGASGYRPEHTLAAYHLAIAMGADYIEPDLVMTKDGVLVARHENEISGTTDVATKFPGRRRTKTIDGVLVSGWFTEDLTLAELKTLRARERLATRSQNYNGNFEIPTFSEVLALARRHKVGVMPEMKHPSHFAALGLGMEKALAAELRAAGWDEPASPVMVQCFELAALRNLREKEKTGVRLLYLYESATELPPWSELAAVVQAIGPPKERVDPEFVGAAHKAGLAVFPYTFRGDAPFVPKEFTDSPEKEFARYFDWRVDGVFADFPDQAVRARNALEN